MKGTLPIVALMLLLSSCANQRTITGGWQPPSEIITAETENKPENTGVLDDYDVVADEEKYNHGSRSGYLPHYNYYGYHYSAYPYSYRHRRYYRYPYRYGGYHCSPGRNCRH